MFKQKFLNFLLVSFLLTVSPKFAYSEIINEIRIVGNERIPKETILVFSKISENDRIDENKLNEILKNLYDSKYFSFVNVTFENKTLNIIS